MRIREYSRFWLRSAYGIGSLFLSLAAGLGAGMLAGWRDHASLALGVALPAAAASFGLLYLACLATGLGSKAAFAEAGRDSSRDIAGHREGMADARKRLSALRLADEGVAAARDLVVLQAGRFLESARAAGAEAWEPGASAALSEALDLVDAWLREADETAIERRFEAADAHPFENARDRVIALLKDKAAAIASGIDAVTGEPVPPDRIAIEEEGR